jgi:N-acetylglutamate synthase-like GNAT family acetyltransferase
MTDPIIREATLNDAQALVDYLDALGEENLDTIAPRSPLTVEKERAILQEVLDNPRAFFLIALDSGRVIGVLNLHTGMRAHEMHAGKLGISIAKDWRGRGIGRALMTQAIATTKAWDGFCRIASSTSCRGTPMPSRSTKVSALRSRPLSARASICAENPKTNCRWR